MPITHPVQAFMALHAEESKKDDLRAGQRFVNLFLKDDKEVPGLFYEKEDYLAFFTIRKWLDDHHYTDCLPQPLDRENGSDQRN